MSDDERSHRPTRRLVSTGPRRRWSFSWSDFDFDRTLSESSRGAPFPEPPRKVIVPHPPLVPVLHPKDCKGEDDDVARMASFLEEQPESLDALFAFKAKNGKIGYLTPLTSACKMLHVKCVEFLLDKGARVDVEVDDQHAIAHAAIASQNVRFPLTAETSTSNCETIVKMIIEKKSPDSRLYETDYKAYRDLVSLVAKGLNLYNIVKILLESNEINFLSAQNRLYSLNGEPYTSNVLSQISGSKNYDIRLMKLFIVHGDSFENKEPIRIKRQNNFYEYTFLTSAFPYQIITSSEDIGTKIELLKIFHYFGGNLKAYLLNERGGCETLLQCMEKMPEQIQEEGVAKHVEELMNNPVSLRQACRHKLWKVLRGKYWRFVTTQPGIPRDIVNFLLMEEV